MNLIHRLLPADVPVPPYDQPIQSVDNVNIVPIIVLLIALFLVAAIVTIIIVAVRKNKKKNKMMIKERMDNNESDT